MNRRDFMAAALSGMALLGGAGVSRLDRVLAPNDADPALAVLLRRNVYCLNDSSPQIVAYRNAIAAMQALPATNPVSWLAQANIHGTFSPPPGMITDACQHGNTFFLSWHRMYLYYFERIIRKHSGDANFALPYWGYSPSSTARRVLPAMFRTPSGAGNKLFVSQRRATINAGGMLTASTVDPGAALLQIAFGSFSSSLEGTPHGVVHTGVGGPGGWMSAFETAGQDPIFWLHHAMVDRLWSLWLAQGGGRANPTSASWLTTNFQFYNENGATVNMSGQQVVDTATQLNYNYASALCLTIVRPPVIIWRELTLIPPFDRRALELVRVIQRRPPLPDPPPEVVVQQGLRLGPAPAEARIEVRDEVKRALGQLSDASAAQGASNLSLVLDDIRLEQPAEVFYEVYVNLPSGERPVYTSPSYVGNLDFFGPSPQGKHREMPLRRTLSILPAFVRLRAANRWSDDALRVTLVPRAYTENESPARSLKERPQATVGRVALRVE